MRFMKRNAVWRMQLMPDRAKHSSQIGSTVGGSPKVFTIAPGSSFLDTLAEAILDGRLGSADGGKPNPIDLTDLTLLMPTRRAERALSEAFLKAGGGRAMLLPLIRPISDRDEEESLISELARTSISTDGARSLDDILPAIDPMDRVLLLSRLILQWSERMRAAAASGADVAPALLVGARSPSQAVHLAKELARLMDLVETEGQSLDGLQGLVPDALSEHWQVTLKFLEIVTHYWPLQLEELGVVSPWQRKNQLIRVEARRIADTQTQDPVIVAGVTGSIPATVDYMRAVMSLDNGAVVLQGLDLYLDEESWNTIVPHHPEHPQFSLKKLIDALGVARSEVCELEGKSNASKNRERFVSEAMRPAKTTQKWYNFTQQESANDISQALNGISVVALPTPQDESEAIALIMREIANRPDETAALVTPDRLLARRVAIRLDAWGIEVDDSAGRPFAKTVPGTFLDLVISCVAHNFAPADVMSLLKHPLCRLGLSARDIRFAARSLELIVFRRIYIGEGLDGIATALERAQDQSSEMERPHRAVRRQHKDDWARARNLVELLRVVFNDIIALFENRQLISVRELASAHIVCAERLCQIPVDERKDADQKEDADNLLSPLYEREAGAAAATLFRPLLAEESPAPEITANDYPDLFRTLIGTQTVREQSRAHPRLFIWGPMEARLMSADTVILGALHDRVWPGLAEPGPWLNRPMRQALSLPSPEEENGRKAHDFTTLLGAPRVIITRAEKVDGVPAAPSRWLMRLEALIGGFELDDPLQPDDPWHNWARLRDAAGQRGDVSSRISRPRPCPPTHARPRSLSVSAVESFLANPYAIHARQILRLEPLPPLGQEPDAALRGAVIHYVLARFSKRYPKALPQNTAGVLLELAREVLTEISGHPRVSAFWLPRFQRFADWFAETDPDPTRPIATT